MFVIFFSVYSNRSLNENEICEPVVGWSPPTKAVFRRIVKQFVVRFTVATKASSVARSLKLSNVDLG